jgi:hypothetical protein
MTHVSFTIPKDRGGNGTLAEELIIHATSGRLEATDRVLYGLGIRLILDGGTTARVTM